MPQLGPGDYDVKTLGDHGPAFTHGLRIPPRKRSMVTNKIKYIQWNTFQNYVQNILSRWFLMVEVN